MIELNRQKIWEQDNSTDMYRGVANVHVTKNVTFDEEGYLRLSYSPRAAMNEGVDADFDNPAAILFSSDYGYFTQTWDDAFEIEQLILSERPTQVTTSGVPSGDTESDVIWFGNQMVTTNGTQVDYYNPTANTWTNTSISLTNNSGQHQLVNFLSLTALAIADVNTVKLYASPLTATPTLITTLTISAEFQITGMCYFNQNLYIVTQNVQGGHAVMYVWNGLGTAAQQVYEADSNIIFSICVHENTIVVSTGNGTLLYFSGSGFEFLAGFPMFYTDQALTDENNITIYKNTLKSNGNLLYCLFTNEQNNNNRLLSQPDGIWCFDKKIGLYHRYSLSNALVQNLNITQANVNTTTDQITVTYDFPTGTEVVFTELFGLAPLVSGTKYYVNRVDATHIRLSETLADAEAGVYIDLISSGASNPFTFFPNIDFGQYFNSRPTALCVIERPVSNRIYGCELMWGGEVVRRDSTSDYGTLGTVSNGVGARGFYQTPKIFSDDVTDTYNLLTFKFSKLTSELDKFIIKYRTTEDTLKYINLTNWGITWTSTTTFTTTNALWADAAVGNEVTVLQGAAGGLIAHITAISENAGTYAVTLDESYDNYVSGDISRAVFSNWIKWRTIEYGDSNAEQQFLSEQLGVNGKFLEVKVEMRGVNVRIEDLLIDNKYRLPKKSK